MDENNQTTTPGETNELPKQEATEVEPEAQEVKTEVAEEPQKGEKKEEPTPKMYSEEELQKRLTTTKGGYEGTIQEMRGNLSKLQQEHANAIAQLEEFQTQSFLKNLEAQAGDNKNLLSLAKQVVEREKATAAKERQINELAFQLATKKAELDKAGKGKKAYDLVKEYGLEEKVVEELFAISGGDAEMENEAMKRYIKKLKAEAKPTSEVASGTGTGKGGYVLDKLSDTEKLKLALSHKI